MSERDASRRDPGGERLCVVCDADSTNADGGEPVGPVHVVCWLRIRRAMRIVASVLRAARQKGLCHSCLALRVDTREAIVRQAAWRLGSTPDFRMQPGLCARCGLRAMITYARADRPRRPPWVIGDVGTALDEFGVQVRSRVYLAVSLPSADVSALSVLAASLLERGALRLYVAELEGRNVDWQLRTDPRVMIVASAHGAARLEGLPEHPALAALDLRAEALEEALSAVSMLDRRGEMLLRVRLDSLSPGTEDAYARIRVGLAILGVARWAVLRGWHVTAVAPSMQDEQAHAPAFFLHLTADRPSEADPGRVDRMMLRTVEGLASSSGSREHHGRTCISPSRSVQTKW